ncbi:alpha/beta fold hydrolase [Novosphingobium sp. FKTRR1]|uniref:alpha/beta fold hydrolase n=1 Tax=Novosphingobium sp. FKTRR1 TaxID=2879118 RepID=UPI001CEFB57E|nr:alpha/beta hydrolase [Novosphingobium sp. FKTRR1]
MAQFETGSWTSRDGLTLRYRDYAGGADGADAAQRPAILCLHGLTRNARDFEQLAGRLAGHWRVICPDMRGRGESDYARDPMTYNPAQYLDDLEQLLAQLGLVRFVAIGTSLGGLLTMLLAASGGGRIAGAVLNDVGPVVEEAGLARIRDYVGSGRSFETWMHAARGLKDTNAAIYPDYTLEDWLRMAKRLMVVNDAGRIVFDYDMKIGEPFEIPGGATPAVDLWPLFDGLASAPLLLVRGETSDILSAETAAMMAARNPAMAHLVLPRIGHAPTLDEPASIAAIDALLAQVG